MIDTAALSACGVVKRYGQVVALAGVDLAVQRGELLTLLGPSGSGKTSLLKAIAGFEQIDSGRITLEGRDLTHVPPNKRDIGMVFQNYALFPHLTVEDNIGFPLRMRGFPRDEIARRTREVLALIELDGFGRRYPRQLSGGQQQRVALARAVVFKPELLLLDEPFAALDRQLRETMRVEVRALQRRLKVTTIFITHDQDEALSMSDRIGVMRAGQIQQLGTPAQIYDAPANEFVANFVGESNLIRGTVATPVPGQCTLLTADGRRFALHADARVPADKRVSLLLRPEAMAIIDDTDAVRNTLPNRIDGRLADATYLGNAIKWTVEAADGTRLTVREAAGGGPGRLRAVGDPVVVGWHPDSGHLIEACA